MTHNGLRRWEMAMGALMYLMLAYLLLQFGCLSADGLGVGQPLLRGSQPLGQGLQRLVKLLSHNEDAVQLLVSAYDKSRGKISLHTELM